jgi:hypothetical protein
MKVSSGRVMEVGGNIVKDQELRVAYYSVDG